VSVPCVCVWRQDASKSRTAFPIDARSVFSTVGARARLILRGKIQNIQSTRLKPNPKKPARAHIYSIVVYLDTRVGPAEKIIRCFGSIHVYKLKGEREREKSRSRRLASRHLLLARFLHEGLQQGRSSDVASSLVPHPVLTHTPHISPVSLSLSLCNFSSAANTHTIFLFSPFIFIFIF
jgi:hypothetical protein